MSSPEGQPVTALRDIPVGHQLSEQDISVSVGSGSTPTQDTARSPHGFEGNVALVHIPKGSPIVAPMLAPSLGSHYQDQGLLVTSVQIANPEILQFAHQGSTITLIAHTNNTTQVITSTARIVSPPQAPTSNDTSEQTLINSGIDTTNDQQSSTVLVAVRPKEAEQLAQTLSWEATLMAALVS